MEAYVAGSDSAFTELFGRYGGVVYRRMRRIVGTTAALDLTQQTFLHLHRSRRDYRAGAPVAPWILTIAQNVLRDHLRRRARAPFSVAHFDEPAARARPQAESDARESVQAALAQLPDTQRAVVRAHWFEHRSFPQIARELGITPGAVRVRAHRAYRTLRRVLLDQGYEA